MQAQPLHPDLNLVVAYVAPGTLKGYGRNARTHSKRQVEQIAESIRAFGFVSPLVVDEDGTLIAGHGRLAAADLLGLLSVPVVRLEHLDEAKKRALRLADDRLAELAGWDQSILSLEFKDLLDLDMSIDLDFDLSITGFGSAEIDQLVSAEAASLDDEPAPEADRDHPAVSRLGDLWLLGDHRLICGDARDEGTYSMLMAGELATMGIHDAPYDVPISGHVAKPGRHREFVMGAGELGAAFTPFLAAFLRASSTYLVPGGYQLGFMDWRHLLEMMEAGREAGLDLRNLCVWNKGSGAMGSLYRSQHELVFVFQKAGAPGINNVQLGRFGRNRTNVWDYPGASSMRAELELHPTPKHPVMIADAIRDVSNRNDIVLDAFSGSGTTIVAAQKTGRRGYAVELDPHYVDVGVRRWQGMTGDVARHAETGLTFDETARERAASLVAEPVAPSSPKPRVRHRIRSAA